MNIVIIEDEPLTAEDLTGIIVGSGADIRVTAVLDSVKTAIAFFLKAPPVDLVFSDIQLGDGLSFEIFRVARVDSPIVFCTAYNEYALDAIRSNGIDYILKPYDAKAITRAIEKYYQLKRHFVPADIDYEKLIRTITGSDKMQDATTSILVYHRDKIIPISFHEIALFYIDHDLTHLHCFNGRSYVVNLSLGELEERGKGDFFRISRQYLINRRAVVDANHYEHRKYVVNINIHFKEVLVVSKNRNSDFLTWLMRK
jgi:DNA-binding LytR/AlgR family response regulator